MYSPSCLRCACAGVASHEPSVSSEVALRIADWICEKLSTCYSTYPPPATVLREELEMLAVARRVQGVSSIQLVCQRTLWKSFFSPRKHVNPLSFATAPALSFRGTLITSTQCACCVLFCETLLLQLRAEPAGSFTSLVCRQK